MSNGWAIMSRRAVLMAAVSSFAVACGAAASPSAPPAPPPAAGPQTHTVKLLKQSFSPSELTVRVGDSVRFVVVEGAPHSVTFEPDGVPGANAAGKAKRATALSSKKNYGFLHAVGEEYVVKFEAQPSGEYAYFCIPHKAMGMTGTITVK